MTLAAGTRVHQFEVLGILGRGGMGTVYTAEDTVLQRTVALKILHAEVAATREQRQRFLREARLAAALDHPGVATVYEVGESDDLVFIAMERVQGSSLRARLDAEKPAGLPVPEVLDIARQVAEVLGAAHAQGIVHRDLKPENVVVTPAGRVKLLDFGIAKAVERDRTDPGAGLTTELTTQAGSFLGTPAYVSPEQARGANVDARSDVFSLGVVLYELLTAERPFRGSTFQDIIASILRDDPRPPSAIAHEVPPWVDSLVLRCLEKDPAARFADGAAIAAELTTTDATTASRAGVTSLPPASKRGPRSRNAAVVGVIVGVTVLGVVGARALRSPSTAPVPPAPSATAASSAALGVAAGAEAQALFAEGERLFRDGRMTQSLAAFEKAVAVERDFAAAHLQLALSTFQTDPQRGRQHFERATTFRDRLGPRDRALHHAAEAYVRPKTDFALLEERLTEALAQFPGDPQMLYWQGIARQFRGNFEGAVASYDAVVRADPSFARGWWLKAQALSNQGKLDDALASLDQCLRHSAGAITCLQERAFLARETGDCEGMARDARAATTYEPEFTTGYALLASALASSGEPMESISQVLALRAAKSPENERAAEVLRDDIRVALHVGDFDRGIEKLREVERALAAEPDLTMHGWVTGHLAAAYWESGRPKEAGAAADALLARYAGLEEHPFGDPLRMALHRYQLRAGTIDAARYRAIREEWLAGFSETMKARGTTTNRGFAWLYGYAVELDTRAEAEEALAALPDYEPLAVNVRESAIREAALGHVLLLAERPEEALPHLRSAEGACYALTSSWLEIGSKLWLGQALEATGDAAGARAMYEQVLARWGQARPASRTADEARRRLAKLPRSPER